MTRLRDLLERYQPESHPHEQETWPEIGARLWRDEPAYMTAMRAEMVAHGWIAGVDENGVEVHDGHVQNGHHRITIARGLGWHDKDIPVKVLAR